MNPAQVKGWHKNAEKARDKERTERLAALKDNDFDKSVPARARPATCRVRPWGTEGGEGGRERVRDSQIDR